MIGIAEPQLEGGRVRSNVGSPELQDTDQGAESCGI